MCPQAEIVVIVPKCTCGAKGHAKTRKHMSGLPDHPKAPGHTLVSLPSCHLHLEKGSPFKFGGTFSSKATRSLLHMNTGFRV